MRPSNLGSGVRYRDEAGDVCVTLEGGNSIVVKGKPGFGGGCSGYTFNPDDPDYCNTNVVKVLAEEDS